VVKVLPLYTRLSRLPRGRRLFSIFFARRAPYFRTVRPYVAQLRPHFCEVHLPDRKAVHNHIGTVHAIAICNGLEAAMGALAEVTTPPGERWLPKGMTVEYLAKSNSDLVCTATTTPGDWAGSHPRDVPVSVQATRADGTVVVRGTIMLWVTARKGQGVSS
jgi:acyl-coenzyme A thioesterase PaaI-like protein